MVSQLINANPTVYERQERRGRARQPADDDEYAADPIDQQEVFDILLFPSPKLLLSGLVRLVLDLPCAVLLVSSGRHDRDIKDPEHPYTLEELKVVSEDAVEVDDKQSYVRVTFTPTVEHCSMATLIGLSIRVKLMRSLPSRYKVDIRVAPGTHATETAVNKQLNDKERVAAALENPNLLDMVEDCLAQTYV